MVFIGQEILPPSRGKFPVALGVDKTGANGR